MTWEPISEEKLWDEINESYERMDFHQRRLWERIRIEPEKWELHPWGDKGGGFWVVAILGRTVIYFNDIEDGFNRSTYSKYGKIRRYFCNQDYLEWPVQYLLDEIRDGTPSGLYAGPPEPLT